MTTERIAFEPFGSLAGVLEGQPFRIFPQGTYHRGERKLAITPQRLQEFAANVKAGLPRFRIPINIEHDRTLGKYGTVEDVDYRADGPDGPGLYATKYQLTDEGRRWLQAGKADAVSGEAIWTLNGNAKYQDPTTGKHYDNVLAGVALTATPFFGNEVNLFSALEGMSADDSLDAGAAAETPAADAAEGAESMAEDTQATPPATEQMTTVISAEEFAALKTRLEQAEQRAELFAKGLADEKRANRVAALQARAERFVALAAPDTFAAKMFELEQFSPDLAAYFDGLLEQADKQIAQGELFSQKGSERKPAAAGESLTDLAAKLHAEKFDGHPDKYSEALTLAGKQRPDLMLAYLRTAPGMDGEE